MSTYTISAANWGLVFYGPQPTVTLTITAGATSYSVIDIYGATVSSGTISATATSCSPTPPSGGWINGWYLVQLAGPSSYAVMSTFQVINDDSRFKNVGTWGEAVNAADPQYVGDDYVGLLTSQMGAYRWEVANTASPSSDISAIQQNITFWENWVTADTVRKPTFIVAFGGGSTDTAKIGNITLYRRGTHTDAASITIGAGTLAGYKFTVTDTTTSTVVETHDNCNTEEDVQTAVNAQSNGWVYAWGAQHTAPTETTVTLGNSNTLGVIQLVQAVYNYNALGVTWFEGPENEPGGGDPGGTAAFISTVHAANASAKAMGPSYLGAQNGNMAKWIADMQTIGVTPDGVSFHPYNLLDSADLDAEDQTFPDIVDAIRTAWGQNMPIFCTEFGWISTVGYSLLSPYLSARQMVGILAFIETVGIPKERFFYFYCYSHGYGGFPSWWKNGDSSLLPQWLAARGVSERLYGTTFAERITLPSPVDRMVLAVKWTDTTNQTIFIQPTGLAEITVNVSVSGATSLTTYDWAGNQSSVVVTNNAVTLTVTSLGIWLVAPLAATITLTEINNGLLHLGTNQADYEHTGVSLLTSSTVASDQSGNPGHPGVMWLNGVDPMTADRTNVGQLPWKDTSKTLPTDMTVTFDTPTQIDRALIFCPPPITEGQRNSITAFEIQYQAPGASIWTTVYTYTNATATSATLVGDWINNMGSGTHVTWLSVYNQQYHFDCAFSAGPVVAQAVKIVVTATSYGDSPDTASNSNGVGANLVPYLECRFVGLYCVDAQVNKRVLV